MIFFIFEIRFMLILFKFESKMEDFGDIWVVDV